VKPITLQIKINLIRQLGKDSQASYKTMEL